MKISLALALALLASQNAFAASIPDCFKKASAVPGQFIVLLEKNADNEARAEVINKLAKLDLSVVDSFGATMLVESAALGQLTRGQELAVLDGLAGLLGNGVRVITCNTISRAL